MRTVFDSSSMVVHVWANQSQERGRNKTSSLYFNGSVLFSYGSHFPVATLVTNKHAETAVIFSSASFSVTTSSHQRMARSAASHIQPQFTVPHICDRWGGGTISHEDNLRFYTDAIQAAALAAKRAKVNRDWKLRYLDELADEANAYCEFFGLRTRFKVPSDANLNRLILEARKDAQRQREETKRRQQERLEQLRESIEKWKSGEDVHLGWDCPDIFLRIRGDTVQTSRGAEVPLAHAVKILPIVRGGRTYEHNGHSIHLGHFRIDKIDAHGNLTAGCHFIKREEMERIAAQLGLQQKEVQAHEHQETA